MPSFLWLWWAGVALYLRSTGFSLQWLLLMWSTGSRVGASVVSMYWLSCSFDPLGSYQIRDQTCIGRWILYHWATREAPEFFIFFIKTDLRGATWCFDIHVHGEMTPVVKLTMFLLWVIPGRERKATLDQGRERLAFLSATMVWVRGLDSRLGTHRGVKWADPLAEHQDRGQRKREPWGPLRGAWLMCQEQ